MPKKGAVKKAGGIGKVENRFTRFQPARSAFRGQARTGYPAWWTRGSAAQNARDAARTRTGTLLGIVCSVSEHASHISSQQYTVPATVIPQE